MELNKTIIKLYPFLYDGREDYDFSWTWCDFVPESVQEQFAAMCFSVSLQLKALEIEDFYFIEVKEKYGELRIYCNKYVEEIERIIRAFDWKI